MSSGLLQQENVVFYHPLDSGAVEFCENSVWSGSVYYIDRAQVGEGIVGIPSGSLFIVGDITQNSGTQASETDRDTKSAWLDEDRVIIIDRNVSASPQLSGIILQYNGEFTNSGSAHFPISGQQFEAGGGGQRRHYAVSRLSSSGFVVVHESGNAGTNVSGVARYYSSSGFTATLVDSEGFTGNNARDMTVVGITPSSFVVCWADVTDAVGTSVVGTINSNGQISYGSQATFSPSNIPLFVNGSKLSTSGIVVVFRTAGGTSMANVASINGTTLTWGTQTQYSLGALTGNRTDVSVLDYNTSIQSGNIVAIYSQGLVPDSVAVIGSISGNAISFPATGSFSTLEYDDAAVCGETSGTFLVFYSDETDGEHGTLKRGTWDGGSTITFDSEAEFFAGNVNAIDADKTQFSAFIVSYTDGDDNNTSKVKIVNELTFGSLSGNGSLYPSSSGITKLAVAGWVRNPTYGGYLRIERGYRIELGLDYISLGSGTARWDSAGVQQFLADLNSSDLGFSIINTDPHFFVLDFENTGGSNWILRTSFDGSGFVNQGTQDTGSQDVIGTSTNPAISIISGQYPIWVDETALWFSNTTFGSTELNRLYQLGVGGSGLNQYFEAFPPTSGDISLYIAGNTSFNSIPLFISGIASVNNDIPLFIEAIGSVSGSGDLFVSGIGYSSGGIPLIVYNTQVAQSSTLFLMVPYSGGIPLFLRGGVDSFNAFVKTSAISGSSEDIPFFINGIPSGSTDVFYFGDGVDLFIFSDGTQTTSDQTFNAFVKTTSDGFPVSGQWGAFVKGSNANEESITLFTFGHASGESPAGLPSSGELDLFIRGLTLIPDADDDLAFVSSNAFVRVQSGQIDSIDLFISGQAMPSSTMDLFIFGISGIQTGSIDMVMRGNDEINNSINFTMFGISGISSGSLNLFIFADLGEEDNNIILYTHGF